MHASWFTKTLQEEQSETSTVPYDDNCGLSPNSNELNSVYEIPAALQPSVVDAASPDEPSTTIGAAPATISDVAESRLDVTTGSSSGDVMGCEVIVDDFYEIPAVLQSESDSSPSATNAAQGGAIAFIVSDQAGAAVSKEESEIQEVAVAEDRGDVYDVVDDHENSKLKADVSAEVPKSVGDEPAPTESNEVGCKYDAVEDCFHAPSEAYDEVDIVCEETGSSSDYEVYDEGEVADRAKIVPNNDVYMSVEGSSSDYEEYEDGSASQVA